MNRVIHSTLNLLVGLTLVALATVFSLQTVIAQDRPVFYIGVLGEQNGALAMGAQLAVDEFNASGGVEGADGTHFNLELLVQPFTGVADIGSALSMFQQSNVIAILGPESNTDALGNLLALQQSYVPVLTSATDNSLIVHDSTGRLFRIRSADTARGEALANYLVAQQGVRSAATVQLDVESTTSANYFANAMSVLGIPPQAFLRQTDVTISMLADSVINSNAQAVVVFGDPQSAGALYTALRLANWPGFFAHYNAVSADFLSSVQVDDLRGIIAVPTWVYTAPDGDSRTFLANYVQAFGRIPGAVEVSGYDAVLMIAAAIGRPGELQQNLLRLNNVNGVQGDLSPLNLLAGEMSNYVFIAQFNARGVPVAVARYLGASQLELVPPPPAPEPVPFVEFGSVTLTVTSRFQNVRLGPSTAFDVIGRLDQNTVVPVIGANADQSWMVIDFRGTQGWLFASIADISGDMNQLPLIAEPPLPLPPLPLPTAVPAVQAPPTTPQFADIMVTATNISPVSIMAGQPFTVNVTVTNFGALPAGQFAVAATFPPDGVFASAIVPGLNPGQQTNVALTATLNTTGSYSAVIVLDLNNTVAEGDAGEANNDDYVLSYLVDHALISQSNYTFNPNDTLNLEGDAGMLDLLWTINESSGQNGAVMGVLSGANYNTVTYDTITSTLVQHGSLSTTLLPVGTVVGILTGDGNRGVMRIDANSGDQLMLTYRVYQN